MGIVPFPSRAGIPGSTLLSQHVYIHPGRRKARSEIPESSGMGSFLSELSPEAMEEFELLRVCKWYEAGSLLVREGQAAEYVYFVIDGSIKLSMNSPDGHRFTYRLAQRGDVIGISAVILDIPHDSTAEAIHACKIASVARKEFLAFLLRDPHTYPVAMKVLSAQYAELCETLRSLSLNSNATSKVARLLLKWSASGGRAEYGRRVMFALTHEEVGQFIGASRETVTRTLAKFKQKRLIEVHGSVVIIPNKRALEKIAGVESDSAPISFPEDGLAQQEAT